MKKTEVKKEIKKVVPKEKKLPEATFRSGVVKATIWGNVIETEKFGKKKLFSFDIQRGYKDKDDEWQNTHSMRREDLASMQMLLNKVSEFILLDEDAEEEEEAEEELEDEDEE